MAKVYAPNEQYTGVSASVMFVDGVGETSDPHLLAWFKIKGYRVEEDVEVEKPAEQLTVPEIKQRLDTLGIEYDKNAKKAELLELLENQEE